MKVKRWIIAGCAALAIGVLAETTSAQTSQVFRVEASLSGVVINSK